MAVNNAVATTPALSGLTLRVDNGSQYTSREFRSSMDALEITLEHIYANTLEQNGHIEYFHQMLKSTSGRASLQPYKRPKRHACRIGDYNSAELTL